MKYKRETIVNIGALESAVNSAYIDTHNLRMELEKEKPDPDKEINAYEQYVEFQSFHREEEEKDKTQKGQASKENSQKQI